MEQGGQKAWGRGEGEQGKRALAWTGGRKLLERGGEPRLGGPQIPPELDSLDSVGGGHGKRSHAGWVRPGSWQLTTGPLTTDGEGTGQGPTSGPQDPTQQYVSLLSFSRLCPFPFESRPLPLISWCQHLKGHRTQKL